MSVDTGWYRTAHGKVQYVIKGRPVGLLRFLLWRLWWRQ